MEHGYRKPGRQQGKETGEADGGEKGTGEKDPRGAGRLRHR